MDTIAGTMLFDTLLFIVFLAMGLYLPGRLLFQILKIKLDPLSSLFLPLTTGILLFTLIAYLLALIHLSLALLPLCILANLASLIIERPHLPHVEQKHLLPLFLTGICGVVFASITFPTGMFHGTLVYRHDDLWHLMLINQLLHNFPPNNPGFSNIPLHGYHFFFDFLLAQVNHAFFISVPSLYFRLFPLLLAYLWSVGVYVCVFVWSKKIRTSLLSVVLTLFGGSFAYGLLLQGHPGYSWDSGLGISQPASSLLNDPFVISIGLFVSGLLLLYLYLQTKRAAYLVPFVLTVGLLPMFKVYAGILLMAAYGFLLGTELYRKNIKILWTLPFVAALFFSTYWYFAGGSGFLIWFPLWGPTTILQSFPWYHYDNKIYVYGTEHVWRGLFNTEVDGLITFLFGNLGSRVIGLFFLLLFALSSKKKPSLFAVCMFFLSIIAIGIPLFFIQSGKVFEIIQMSWYYLFLAGIGAAFGLEYFFEQKFPIFVQIIFLFILAPVTFPSAYEVFIHNGQDTLTYSPSKDIGIVTLAKDPDYSHVVLELPDTNTLQDVHDWYMHQMPTVVTFGNKSGYVANEFIDFPKVPINERLESIYNLLFFISKPDPLLVSYYKDFLTKNHISYIYSPVERHELEQIPGVKEIYHGTDATLYHVAE